MDVSAKVIVVGLAIAQRLLVSLATSEEAFDEVNESHMHLVVELESGMMVRERMTERPLVERTQPTSNRNFFRSRRNKGHDILSHANEYTFTYVSFGGVHHVAPGQASAACRRIQLPRSRSRVSVQLNRSGTNVPEPTPWLLTGYLLRMYSCVSRPYKGCGISRS